MSLISICAEYSRLKEELRLKLEELPGDNISRYELQYKLEPLHRELQFCEVL